MGKISEKIISECIDCNLCKNNCDFLKKYDINLKAFAKNNELRDSCFLCRKCYEVCPKKLDGKALALEMRRESPRKYRRVQFLKEDYKFRSLTDKESETVLFLGCNYPGIYPKTCEKMIEICKEHNIDYMVECCRKPVFEKGVEPDLTPLYKAFEKKKTKGIITLCPNCYHFFKENLKGYEIISPFTFLKSIGYGKKIEEHAEIFFPCSDRYNLEIFEDIKYFLTTYEDNFKDINCCGLGGGASSYEKDLLIKKGEKLKNKQKNNIYTYCSSCSGIFNKYNIKNIKNILSEVIEVHEEVDKNYLLNVLMYKFKRK